MAFFLALTPWPYADIFPALRDSLVTEDYRRYNLVEPVIKPLNMSIEEMDSALRRATGHFFRDKFERLNQLPPKKREFMVSVLKLLIEHSYLGEEMRTMAGHASMPESVKELVRELGIELPSTPPVVDPAVCPVAPV